MEDQRLAVGAQAVAVFVAGGQAHLIEQAVGQRRIVLYVAVGVFGYVVGRGRRRRDLARLADPEEGRFALGLAV